MISTKSPVTPRTCLTCCKNCTRSNRSSTDQTHHLQIRYIRLSTYNINQTGHLQLRYIRHIIYSSDISDRSSTDQIHQTDQLDHPQIRYIIYRSDRSPTDQIDPMNSLPLRGAVQDPVREGNHFARPPARRIRTLSGAQSRFGDKQTSEEFECFVPKTRLQFLP